MFLIKYRTSISLPIEVVEKLAKVASEDYPVERLAILCLKKFIRRKKIAGISERATCKYNKDGDYQIRNIWLTKSQHHNVKMYRIITGQSVSFLTAQAVLMYLDGLVEVLRRVQANWKSIFADAWLDMQLRALNSIHRILRFSSTRGKGLLGLHVVMQRPGLKWEAAIRRMTTHRPMPPELRERLGL